MGGGGREIAEVKALCELRGKGKVSGTLAIKGFRTIDGVSRKFNSKENISIQIFCLTVWRPATPRGLYTGKINGPESELQATQVMVI